MALRAVNIFIHAFILVHFFALFFSTNNVKTANFKLRVERMAKIKFHAHAVAEDTSKKLQPYFVNFTEKYGFSNILRETTKQHAVQYTLTICSVWDWLLQNSILAPVLSGRWIEFLMAVYHVRLMQFTIVKFHVLKIFYISSPWR